MTAHLDEHARRLLEAPFHLLGQADRLDRSLWLYVRLITAANTQGYICRTIDRLAADLGVGVPEIQAWLDHLAAARLIRIATPPPYLVVKLAFWSGGNVESLPASPESASESASSHGEVPVSSSSKHAASILEDGGLGEGDALVRETIRVLGGGDAGEIRELVRHYPRLVVLKALLRVKVTPAHTIRKSKLALFRYLLVKISNDSHDHDRSHRA